MHRVALTGGIATGKSYVLNRFARLGIPTIDADHIVHELIGPGTRLAAMVGQRFGADMLQPDGGVDRRRLGAFVFSDEARRHELESMIHPSVYERINAWFAGLDPKSTAFAVAGIPLLYETNHASSFDRVIATVCSLEQQVERIVRRDKITEVEARQRVAAQLPAEEKARRATYVIRTEGSKADTDRQVDEIVRILNRSA
jgi:dephospho-CoA kinase